MKVFFRMFMIMASVAVCGACSVGSPGAASPVERTYDSLGPIVVTYLPAIESDSVKNWGLVRPDGTMFVSDRFESSPSAVVNGYFSLRESDGISVWRALPTPAPVEGLRGLVAAGIMSDGLVPVVRKGKRIELVDGDGTVRMELTSIDGREIVRSAPYFVDGVLAVYTQDGFWGGMTRNGEMALEPVYDSMPLFSENIAAVSRTVEEQVDSVTTRKRKQYYLVNTSGKVIFTFPRDVIPRSTVSDGRIVIETAGGHLAMLGVTGRISDLPPKVKSVGEFNRDYVVWSDRSSQVGLLDGSLHELVGPRFRSVALADSNRLLVEGGDGCYAVTDSAGQTKVKLSGFDRVSYLGSMGHGIVSPFRLVGEGYAGAVMLNLRGHRLGTGPFRSLSTSLTLLDDDCVHSDYFNSQAAAHALVAPLTSEGWGSASIGMVIGQLAGKLDESNAGDARVSFARDSLYGCTVEAVAFSDRRMALDSIAGDSLRVFYPDSAARVKSLRVDGAVPPRKFYDIVRHAAPELVERGYRAEKLRDEYAVYASATAIVILVPDSELRGVCLYVMDRGLYESEGPRIIAEAERTCRRMSGPDKKSVP